MIDCEAAFIVLLERPQEPGRHAAHLISYRQGRKGSLDVNSKSSAVIAVQTVRGPHSAVRVGADPVGGLRLGLMRVSDLILFDPEKPGPQGQVREPSLCHNSDEFRVS